MPHSLNASSRVSRITLWTPKDAEKHSVSKSDRTLIHSFGATPFGGWLMFVLNRLLTSSFPTVNIWIALSFVISGRKDFFQSKIRYGFWCVFRASIILNAKVVFPEPDIPVTQMCRGQSFSLSLKSNSFLLA